MLADYATASLKAGRPLLQRSPRLRDRHWSAALAGITNYTAHRLGACTVLDQANQTPRGSADASRVLPEHPRTHEATHNVRNARGTRRHERLHPRTQPGYRMSGGELNAVQIHVSSRLPNHLLEAKDLA